MTETGSPSPTEHIEPPDEVRLIRSLRLTNFLSFGPQGEEIELRGLNVLIGANGSGKTNFVEALGLLAASVDDLSAPIKEGGHIEEWFYKGEKRREISLEAKVMPLGTAHHTFYSLTLEERGQRMFVERESVVQETPDSLFQDESLIYQLKDEFPLIGTPEGGLSTLVLVPDRTKSIFSQWKGQPLTSPYGAMQNVFARIRLYRSWPFGPSSVLRDWQESDSDDEVLNPELSNLFLILQRLDLSPEARAEFLRLLRDFLPDADDFTIQTRNGKVQLYLRQGRANILAARLSDGTLRWLCLLAILVAPAPPSVVVLEEPELGLHPDMINTLADMLKQASRRHQLIVTTHSDILIDALSDVPEAVMVVEKGEGGTTIERLDAEDMKPWLEEYRLGRLWMKGQIGGTRW